MSISLRILLIVGALLALAYFLYQIRKRRLQIDFALFWVLFSGFLLIIAFFPGIIIWLAGFVGFISPANLVFVFIIFLLVVHLFSLTLKLSRLNQRSEALVQRLALLEKHSEDKQFSKNKSDATKH